MTIIRERRPAPEEERNAAVKDRGMEERKQRQKLVRPECSTSMLGREYKIEISIKYF